MPPSSPPAIVGCQFVFLVATPLRPDARAPSVVVPTSRALAVRSPPRSGERPLFSSAAKSPPFCNHHCKIVSTLIPPPCYLVVFFFALLFMHVVRFCPECVGRYSSHSKCVLPVLGTPNLMSFGLHTMIWMYDFGGCML